jgi:hypothetical protein
VLSLLSLFDSPFDTTYVHKVNTALIKKKNIAALFVNKYYCVYQLGFPENRKTNILRQRLEADNKFRIMCIMYCIFDTIGNSFFRQLTKVYTVIMGAINNYLDKERP